MAVTSKGVTYSNEEYKKMAEEAGRKWVGYDGKYFDTTIDPNYVKEKKEKKTETVKFDDSAYKEMERQAYIQKMQNAQNAKQIAASNGQTGGLAQTTMYQPNVQYGQTLYDIGVQKAQDKTAWQEQQAEIARQQKQYEDSLAYQNQQFAYQQQQDKLANELNQQQLSASQKSTAYDQVMQMISYGMVPTDSQLAAVGITREQANQLAAYVKQASYSGSSGGSGSYGSSGSGNLYADALQSGNYKNYISSNYKNYGYTSSAGLADDYKNWYSALNQAEVGKEADKSLGSTTGSASTTSTGTSRYSSNYNKTKDILERNKNSSKEYLATVLYNSGLSTSEIAALASQYGLLD